MRSADMAVLRGCIIECGREVFASYGVAIEPKPDETAEGRDDQIGAFIGFSGNTIRGTVTLAASLSLFRASFPGVLGAGVTGQLQVFDWAGEVANQLLGRLKNVLHDRGVTFEASLPKTLIASQLRVASFGSAHVCALRFVSGDSEVGVWLDAMAATDAPLFEREPPKLRACMAEGDLVLF